MVRMKVFIIGQGLMFTTSQIDKQTAEIEQFIKMIGYENIRNIVASSPGTLLSYTIFYEDHQS